MNTTQVKKNNIGDLLLLIADWGVTVFSTVILLMFLAGFLVADIDVDADYVVSYFPQKIMLFMLAIVLSFVMFKGIQTLLSKLSKAVMVTGLILAWLFVALLCITHIDLKVVSDAGNVYDFARMLVENIVPDDFLEIGSYFGRYPHQLGLAFFESLFGRFVLIESNVTIIWFVLAICNSLFLWFIVENYSNNFLKNEKNQIAKWTLLLGFAFAPALLLFLMIYGEIPACTCFLSAGYLYLDNKRKPSWLKKILALIFFALSVALRESFLICIIAFFITASLESINRKSWKSFLFAIIVLIVAMNINNGIKYCFEQKYDKKIDHATPGIAWVASIGLQESTRMNGAWCPDNTTIIVMDHAKWNVDKAKDISMQKIKKRVHYFSQNKAYTISFFWKKIIGTWCEPTFMSVVHSYGNDNNFITENIHSSMLRDFFGRGKTYRIYHWFCKVIVFYIYLLSLINLIQRKIEKRREIIELFPYITLIGYFLFYCAWETRSRYVITAVFLLIPVAARGMISILNIVQKKTKKACKS